jgi:hypothetical protein
MLALTIFLIVIGAVVLYLLFAPVVLEIDSQKQVYQVRVSSLVRAALRITVEGWYINLQIAFWRKNIDLFNLPGRKPVREKKKARYKKKRHSGFSFREIMAVLKSFRVREWKVILDTGDMALNGKLFPWFYLFSAVTGRSCRISFNDDTVIQLHIRNSIGRMLVAYIRT